MTRDTRVALLVGLAFIVLFGLILGQRSINLLTARKTAEAVPASSPSPAAYPPSTRPGPETATAGLHGGDDRPVLSPSYAHTGTRSPLPAAPVAAAPTPGGGPIAGLGSPALSAPAPPTKTHTVAAGDTLGKIIAQAYPGLSANARKDMEKKLLQANQGLDPLKLKIGKQITLPAAEAPPAARTEAGAVARVDAPVSPETASREDPLAGLHAAPSRLETRPEVRTEPRPAVRPETGLEFTRVEPRPAARPDGTLPPIRIEVPVIRIDPPGSSARRDAVTVRPTEALAAAKTYTVKPGDSLHRIVQATMGSANRDNVKKFMDANRGRIESADKLAVGVTLKVPGST